MCNIDNRAQHNLNMCCFQPLKRFGLIFLHVIIRIVTCLNDNIKMKVNLSTRLSGRDTCPQLQSSIMH
jgi:hypothetical protein